MFTVKFLRHIVVYFFVLFSYISIDGHIEHPSPDDNQKKYVVSHKSTDEGSASIQRLVKDKKKLKSVTTSVQDQLATVITVGKEKFDRFKDTASNSPEQLHQFVTSISLVMHQIRQAIEERQLILLTPIGEQKIQTSAFVETIIIGAGISIGKLIFGVGAAVGTAYVSKTIITDVVKSNYGHKQSDSLTTKYVDPTHQKVEEKTTASTAPDSSPKPNGLTEQSLNQDFDLLIHCKRNDQLIQDRDKEQCAELFRKFKESTQDQQAGQRITYHTVDKQKMYRIYDEEFNKSYAYLALPSSIIQDPAGVVAMHSLPDIMIAISKVLPCIEQGAGKGLLDLLKPFIGPVTGCLYTGIALEKILEGMECLPGKNNNQSKDKEKNKKKKEEDYEGLKSLAAKVAGGAFLGINAAIIKSYTDADGRKITSIDDDGVRKIIIEDDRNFNEPVIMVTSRDMLAADFETLGQFPKIQTATQVEAAKTYGTRVAVNNKNLENATKNFDAIQKKLIEKGIGSYEHLLRTQGNGFIFDGTRNKDGKLLRNKDGAYLDKQGQPWLWNTKDGKIHVTTLHGSTMIIAPGQTEATSQTPESSSTSTPTQIATQSTAPQATKTTAPDLAAEQSAISTSTSTQAPQTTSETTTSNQTTSKAASSVDSVKMTYEELEKPEPQGCGDWREANKFPTILISPTPEIKKPENEGCGKPDPSLQLPDALPGCGKPDPSLEEIKGKHQGCGGMPEKSAEEMQAELFLFAGKGPKKSKLDGYGIKEPTAQEIKDAKEFERLHPHGKYDGAGYHPEETEKQKNKPKKDSPPKKSASPKDGQAALDNSFEVPGSKERVAIENGNIVILKYTSPGIYHGYIHDDPKSLDSGAADVLVNNGIMKDAKSRKITKQ